MSFHLLPLSRLPGAYIRFHYNTLEDICQPQGMAKKYRTGFPIRQNSLRETSLNRIHISQKKFHLAS